MPNRRRFLRAGTGVALHGCIGPETWLASGDGSRTTGSEPSESETGSSGVYGSYGGKPYEGIDWDTYGRHKGQFHIHPHYGDLGPPQELYDHYVALGYDVLCLQPKDDLERGMPWPLEEMGDRHDEWESRYPARDGVVAIPGAEYTDSKHISGFFTELMQETLIEVLGSGSMNDPDHHYDTMEQVLESDPTPETVSPLAFVGHPGRYRAELSEDVWREKWLDTYEEMLADFDTLLGLEAITYSFGYDDRDIWDRLLEDATPDRPVIGTSVDDIGTYEDADRGWVTFYLSPDEFDPLDQRRTQERVHAAWTSGRTSFSTTSEPGAPAPVIESIERDADTGTISIRASGYDVIEWVSGGDVIETGGTIDYRANSDVGTYLRAQIVEGEPGDPDSITCTQAWY